MGNNTKNITDINGKRYDAVTGKLLDGAMHTAIATHGVPRPAIRSVDGFAATKTAKATPANRKAHAPAAHIAPHKPQRAATLMRTAVKKPDLRANRISAQSPVNAMAKVTAHPVAQKLSHASIDPHRQKRAKRVLQSPAVSRYGKISTVDSLSASKTSLAAYAHTATPKALPTTPSARSRQAGGVMPAIPVQPIRHVTKQPDIFEQALARANSHEQKPVAIKRSKNRGRFMGAVTAGLAVLVVVGAFAYFNAAELSLKMASSRAGFAAQLPSYSPEGFTFGNLSYSPGNVTLSYKQDDNEARRYDITQRVSDWDSEGLLSNFVSTAASVYQTYEKAGRTVYYYGNNSATWVDSGVWYVIDGSNSLTKNQVLDLAGSL